MDIYVARQPILDRAQEVYAYELLYRNNTKQNHFANVEGEQATSDVLNSIVQFGFKDLSEGKPCFINFTEKLLENTIPSYFQTNMVVIEVLETVNPTDKVINSCRKLKELGYKIALDDFIMRADDANFDKLLELADIIKVDVRETTRKQQLELFHALKPYQLRYLAEKVETRAEYEQCLKDGYSYFQGYFFSKPVTLSKTDIPFQGQSILLTLSELSREEPDIEALTQAIKSDLSLSYKLLKLINSSILGPTYEIKSIKQAIMYLGFIELRKWIYVLSFRENANRLDNGLGEVVKMSLTRAKTCELLALETGMRNESSSCFLVGMFSLMDTLMKQPLEQIVNELPMENIIKATIMGEKTAYSNMFNLVIAMERADWQRIETLSAAVGIHIKTLFYVYQRSLKWAKHVLTEPLSS